MAATSSIQGNGCSRSPGTRVNLPPEVLERIFWHMDEGTFFIALQTCRQFIQAGSTRKNLLHQVGKLPGLRLGLEDLYGSELRRECYERASSSGCMAWVLADIRICQLPSGTMLSKSIFSVNTVSNPYWSRFDDLRLALANEDGTINLYTITDDDVRPMMTLDVRTSGDRNRYPTIAALAFSPMGDLIVLHEQGDLVCKRKHKGCIHSEYPKLGLESTCRVRKVYELTTFKDCKRELFMNRRSHRRQILASDGATPIGLAMASSDKASVAWSLQNSEPAYQTRIELVPSSKDLDADSTSAKNSELGPNYTHYSDIHTTTFNPFNETLLNNGNTIRMRFVEDGKKLLIHDALDPVHNSFKDCRRGHGNETCFASNVGIEGAIDERPAYFNVGVPFYGSHSSNVIIAKETETDRVCLESYLALGIPHGGVRYLYILQQDMTIPQTACTLQSLAIDEEVLYNQWTPVALLAGWHENRNTLGSILDMTSRRHRIASAIWDRVLVWTFDPDSLHPSGLEHCFPPHDFNALKNIGRLRPISLPRQGVVHALKWTDDDTLFALTDQGLVRWYIGPLASGMRDITPVTNKKGNGPRSALPNQLLHLETLVNGRNPAPPLPVF